MNDSEFITLDVYGSRMDADMMCTLLRENGVDCFVKDSIVNTVMPFVPSSLGLVIARKDEQRAREILAAMHTEEEK